MKRSRIKSKPARRGPMPPDVAYAVRVRDQDQCTAHAHGFDLDTPCHGRIHLHHKFLGRRPENERPDAITSLCDHHHHRAHDVIRAEAEAFDIIRRSTYRIETQ